MKRKQRTYTLPGNFVATNPAGVKARYWRLVRHYPLWPAFILTCIFLLGFILLETPNETTPPRSRTGIAVLSLALGFGVFVHYKRWMEHFLYGDVVPGIVIDVDPLTAAVLTDLRRGNFSCPAIKILKISVGWNEDQSRKYRRGDRMMFVALFRSGDEEAEFPDSWENVNPLPVESATDDIQVIRRVAMIPRGSEWNNLTKWVENGNLRKLGLYRLP